MEKKKAKYSPRGQSRTLRSIDYLDKFTPNQKLTPEDLKYIWD